MKQLIIGFFIGYLLGILVTTKTLQVDPRPQNDSDSVKIPITPGEVGLIQEDPGAIVGISIGYAPWVRERIYWRHSSGCFLHVYYNPMLLPDEQALEIYKHETVDCYDLTGGGQAEDGGTEQ